MNVEEVNQQLKTSPFINHMGINCEEVDVSGGSIVLSLQMQAHCERLPGTGQYHGGVIAALIDTAACYAVMIKGFENVPTIDFRTDYLRPAMNTDLLAEAMIVKQGRTVSVVDVKVLDKDIKLIAVGRGTFFSQG